ncbi:MULTISPECIES: META domain-containing protein [Rhodobacterales]|uniref:META domain-containing protein n=1 Tax=Rhodobacterales TaxID=204455 RepID=UPI0032983CFE
MTRATLAGIAFLATFGALAACKNDETVSAYGAADRVWHLVEIDEIDVTYAATLRFPEPGQIDGDGPCNRFRGAMTVPYPWFDAKGLIATRTACPELAGETQYLAALAHMTLSEVLGDTLILSTPEGRTMVFVAAD